MTCVVNSFKDKLNERYFFESEVTERPMLDARAGKMDGMINRRGKGFDTKKLISKLWTEEFAVNMCHMSM